MKIRINLAKVTSFVMLLTVIAMILVAGTYAKYSSQASGTDATVVAKWSFKVNGTEIAIKDSEPTVTFDLFNTINDTATGEEETDVADGLIAPGTTGSFEFVLLNSSEVTTKYAINLEIKEGSNVPLEFSLDGGNSWTKITELSDLVATDVMAIGATKNVTVQWRWTFDGDTDAALGGQKVEVSASVTATQVDKSDDVVDEPNPEPEVNILISNEDFVYGSYYDLTKNDSTNKDKLTSGDYGKGKTSDIMFEPQDITIKVTNTDVSNTPYNVTLSWFDADGNYKGRNNIMKMTDGELTIKASDMQGPYVRVSVYIYSPFKKIPETAEIVVYGETKIPEESVEESTRNVLIANSKFVNGAYFDLDNSNNPNDDKNAKRTDGSYGLIKTSDTLLPAQDITIKVTDADVSNYKVTIGYFDADGNYRGRNQILAMTDGELTLKASEIGSAYFRVNVYRMPSGFAAVPETAKIVVYAGDTIPNTNWQGKTITVVGDSISTGGWVGSLGSRTGATINNLSVSGTKLTTGITPKVQEMTGESDLIIIFGGTNDYWHKGTQIGTIDSTNSSTYYGALNTILTTLKTNYADSEYLFIFPYDQTFSGDPSSTDYGYGSLDDFRSAFIEFCTKNKVNYIDLGTTEFDCTQHTGDGVHPNAAGHNIITKEVYDYITNN